MFLPGIVIEGSTSVNDIVQANHRTADVFRKYGIEYCCGGRWPLETVCLTKGVGFEQLKKELLDCCHTVQLPSSLPYNDWPVDFLINHIVYIHHHYLKTSLPVTEIIVKDFTANHSKKYLYLDELCLRLFQLKKEIFPHIQQEEESIFPYISQITNAHKNSAPYARLLVKTLRKPIGNMAADEHSFLTTSIQKFRELTGNYNLPDNACVSHKLAFSRLKELDDDLTLHIYLESEILFPKAMKIEAELLQ